MANRELTVDDVELVALQTLLTYFQQKIPDSRKARKEAVGETYDVNGNAYIGTERAETARKFVKDCAATRRANQAGSRARQPARAGKGIIEQRSVSTSTKSKLRAMASG